LQGLQRGGQEALGGGVGGGHAKGGDESGGDGGAEEERQEAVGEVLAGGFAEDDGAIGVEGEALGWRLAISGVGSPTENSAGLFPSLRLT
jgi:hypothetical protein